MDNRWNGKSLEKADTVLEPLYPSPTSYELPRASQ